MTTVPENITYWAEIFNGGSYLVYFVGYVYLLFDCEKAVRSILQECTHDYSSGEYYISGRNIQWRFISCIFCRLCLPAV